ncbi:MAG: hypothetical protein IKQ34_04020 [Bacilli bacterium]|nr:hypothetical protein [Bacilli bacterium]
MKAKKNRLAKKIINVIAFISLASCSAPESRSLLEDSDSIDTSAESVDGPNVIYADDVCNDFDIVGKGNSIIEFARSTNEVFGDVIDVETAYYDKERITYLSNWAYWEEPLTEWLTDKTAKTYKFAKYVSLPVEESVIFCLKRGDIVTLTVPGRPISTENTADVIDRVNKIAESRFEMLGINLGTGNSLADFKALGVAGPESSTVVSNSLYSDLKEIAGTEVYYTEEQKNVTLKNESDHREYYQFHYRGTFALYFTNQYRFAYERTRTGMNLFGLDDKYDYEFKYYEPEKTVFYLLPVDEVMDFVCDRYYLDEEGNSHLVVPEGCDCVYL